jgi:heme oxygenase
MRAAAMKLHTFVQAPKEGGTAPDKPPAGPKYVPTHADYLAFLVNSQHVYQALEEIVNNDANPELAVFRQTGLERVDALETDIAFMCQEYGLTRPEPGSAGRQYAQKLRDISVTSVPEFVCHFYNFSFAHTAGGRMIGKQMSALLLDKKTLEFYKVRYVGRIIFCNGWVSCGMGGANDDYNICLYL